jgi:uncharacterized membrane protein YccC
VAAGIVLIPLGTLASAVPWVAVLSMTVVGIAVLFAGSVSSSIAAAGRSVLLVFILPVLLPGSAVDIPSRLAGWGIASLIAVPVAMLVWPLQEQSRLRELAANVCDALADLAAVWSNAEEADELRTRLTAALQALHSAFRSTAVRPLRITRRSRALTRLIEQVDWLGQDLLTPSDGFSQPLPPDFDSARAAAVDVLHGCAVALRRGAEGPEITNMLAPLLGRLDEESARASEASDRMLDVARTADLDALYLHHQLGHAALLIGATVFTAAGGDASTLSDKDARTVAVQPFSPTSRVIRSYLSPRSVFLHNSIRGGVGLGLAVLVVELINPNEGFWVALGALSVLRSSASLTGSTALRAVLGTLVGFAIGAAIVLLIGTATPVLWIVLPLAIFVASLAPEIISFTAGQAGFTVVIIVLFNIISPVGWQVGVTRLEDVALGCASSLVVALLLWPHGARSAIRSALSASMTAGAEYLNSSVISCVNDLPPEPKMLGNALAAGRRLDDAFRQFIAERGETDLPIAQLTELTNASTSLRLTGDAILGLRIVNGNGTGPPIDLAAADSLIFQDAAATSSWFRMAATAIETRRYDDTFPECADDQQIRRLEASIREQGGDAPLLWIWLYLRQSRLRERVVDVELESIGERAAARSQA